MTVTISTPLDSDRDDWARLYRGYATFYNMPMSDDTLSTVWGWIHDESNPFWCRLAKNGDGESVGLMHFRQMPSPLRGCQVGFLDDLFVDPTARGQGAVDALFTDLKAHARAQDWPAIRWITADDNYRARGVYDKLSRKTQWNTYQLDIGD